MRKIKYLLAILANFFIVGTAFAQEGAAAATGGSSSSVMGLAVAICMGAAAAFGTMGQSRAAAAALEGIARNPQAAGKVQTPMIIAMALMESLVIFAFAISYLLLQKI